MSSQSQAPKWISALVIALLLTLWTFWQTAGFGLTWTDDAGLLVNPQTQPGASGAWLAMTRGFFIAPGNYWRPLPLLSFQISNLFPLGERLEAAHVFSVLLATVYVLCVFLLAGSLRSRSAAQSNLLAALCAYVSLYPALVEGVAWIAGRFDLLLTICSLLVFAFAVSDHRRPAAGKLVMVGFLSAAGMLCKETGALAIASALASAQAMAGLLPPVNGIGGSTRWRAHGCVWIATATLWVAGLLSVTDLPGIARTLGPRSSLFDQGELAFWLYACYWRILLLPLIFTSPVHVVPQSMANGALAGVLTAAATAALIARLALQRNWQAMLLAAALGLPLLCLALLGSTARFDLEIVAADRYLLPFMPAFLCSAYVALSRLSSLLHSPNAAPDAGRITNLLASFVLCLAIADGVHNRSEAKAWQNQTAFWSSVWTRSQDSTLAAVSWATDLVKMGRSPEALEVMRRRVTDLQTAENSYLDPHLTWNRVAIVVYAQFLDDARRADAAIALLDYWIQVRSVRNSMLYGAWAVSLAHHGDCLAARAAAGNASWKDEMHSFFIDLDDERARVDAALGHCAPE